MAWTSLPAGTARSTVLRKRMNSWWVWRCMQRPCTTPSSVLRAANRVVVPCRLSSCVIVPHLPGLIGKPGWVRSSAWICDFSSIESTGMGWRMHVETDDIFHLLGESRVAGALEGAQAMWLQAVGAPDTLYGVQRQADGFGHRAAGPVGHFAGRVAAGQR